MGKWKVTLLIIYLTLGVFNPGQVSLGTHIYTSGESDIFLRKNDPAFLRACICCAQMGPLVGLSLHQALTDYFANLYEQEILLGYKT